MAKKWICTVCGYIAEGETAPEKCPMCGAPQSKFKELNEEDTLNFVTEHEIGVAKGTSEEMIKDLNTHFMGECTEVGMYLAMSRQADREGYPEIAEAFKRYAWEEAEHASKFAGRYPRHRSRDGQGRGPSRPRLRRSLRALLRQQEIIASRLHNHSRVCRLSR